MELTFMKNLILLFITMTLTSTILKAEEGPGSTSGGHRCRQFVIGILAKTKESFVNKEFKFLDEKLYQTIHKELNKIQISPKLKELKSKGRDMEADLDHFLIRIDENYCSENNKAYSPVQTFSLLVHEVLNFYSKQERDNYALTGPNYQEIHDIGKAKVGNIDIGYTIEELLIIKQAREMLKNKKSTLFKNLKKYYIEVIGTNSEMDFYETVSQSKLKLVPLSSGHNYQEELKYANECYEDSEQPKCDIYERSEDWTQEYLVIIDLPDWIQESTVSNGALVHDSYNRVAVLFTYTLIEEVESNDSTDPKVYSVKILKREETAEYNGIMQLPSLLKHGSVH